MIDRRKKYQIQGDKVYPHVGQILKLHFSKKKVTMASMARELGVHRGTVKSYLSNHSLQMGILWKIGIAANHNFLAELAEKFPGEYISRKDKEMQDLLQRRDDQIKMLEAELAVYRRIVEK